MRHISEEDELILEDVKHRVGVGHIAKEIVSRFNKERVKRYDESEFIDDNADEEIIDPEDTPVEIPDGKELVLDFLCKLEGYQKCLKELHWNASHKSEHELADDFRKRIEEVQDDMAEDMMGVFGFRLKPGDLKPADCNYENMSELFDELCTDIFTLRASLEEDANMLGIVSVLDDLIHDLKKSKYLETFA